VNIARNESAAQKCRSVNCGKRKQWHNIAGVENARDEHSGSGKAQYGEPLVAKYRYFTAH